MNRGGPSMSLPTPRRPGIPPQKTCKSRNPSTDGRELRCLLPSGNRRLAQNANLRQPAQPGPGMKLTQDARAVHEEPQISQARASLLNTLTLGAHRSPHALEPHLESKVRPPIRANGRYHS